MNDKLIEEFRCIAKEDQSFSDISYTFTPQQLEKFVQLIVEECANIAYNSAPNGDEIAMEIFYEFDINNARDLK